MSGNARNPRTRTIIVTRVSKHCGRVAFVIGAVWAIGAASALGAESDVKSQRRRTPVVEAVQKVQPCVVSISSEKKAASPSRWPFSNDENSRPRVNGMGTGVIIDGRGYILTNQHVVDKVQGIEVHLADGGGYNARVVQQDEAMDIAVLKIDAGRTLPSVTIGTSADLLVGESVITIGNAYGYENTVSTGIISALNRNVTLSDDQVYRNLIQTDACINPGNSGGPLVNIEGELIGINVAVRAGAQGIGFALPIDEVKRSATEMLSTRRISSTWHGLVSSELRGAQGRTVVLSGVQAGSPAEQAGFKPGDRLLRVGQLLVSNALDIERGLLDLRPGQKAEILVQRGEHEQAIALEVQPLPRTPSDPAMHVWRTLGMRTIPVNREYVAGISKEFRGGLYIQEVAPGGPAARASLQPGDILVGLNDGKRDRETVQLDNVLYILAQPEVLRSQVLPYYIVRHNKFVQGQITLSDAYRTSRR
jgi:serine protease Do